MDELKFILFGINNNTPNAGFIYTTVKKTNVIFSLYFDKIVT